MAIAEFFEWHVVIKQLKMAAKPYLFLCIDSLDHVTKQLEKGVNW